MIDNKVVIVIEDSTISGKLVLKKNQEIEIVMDVVYMSGFPVQVVYNKLILDWIVNNPTLVTDVTKKK